MVKIFLATATVIASAKRASAEALALLPVRNPGKNFRQVQNSKKI